MDLKRRIMKLDEDYEKVMNELQENFGWSNIDILPESYQDLLNDTIMAVKNLTIQRVSVSLPDFLYEDEGEIKVGVHGDSSVTDEWNRWKAGYER